jgi:hypothetical protein
MTRETVIRAIVVVTVVGGGWEILRRIFAKESERGVAYTGSVSAGAEANA